LLVAQLDELGARLAALTRALSSCEAARRACRPGSAKAATAAAQRDALAGELRALTQLLTPHNFASEDDEDDADDDDEKSEPAEGAVEAAC
jgi:hypothetical protein